MDKNIFVYGTLMFPEIVRALTGKTFETKLAILKDYKRHKIFINNKPLPYPAITKSKGNFVEGMLLFNVDEASFKIIDSFENEDYERKELMVKVDETKVKTVTYVWKESLRHKLAREWDKNYFEKNFLKKYVTEIIPEILDEINK